jgi:hypothetical protein
MEKAVEHAGDGRAVPEQFSPLLDWAVGGDRFCRALRPFEGRVSTG